MAKRDVEHNRVRISTIPPPESTIEYVDSVFIVVTQAFCPNGHNLVLDDNEQFDGFPGIRLRLVAGEDAGYVILSPFHGDATKKGKTDWPAGTRLQVQCPECEKPLPVMAKCHCQGRKGASGDLVKLFLTPELNDSHVLALCNVWGCRHSRTIDNWQIISEFLAGQIGD